MCLAAGGFIHVVFCGFFQNQYNLARAQQSYKSLVQIHEKNGTYVLVTLVSSAQQPGNWYLAAIKPEGVVSCVGLGRP